MAWRPFRPGDDPSKAVCFPDGPPGASSSKGRLLSTGRGSVPGNPITNDLELAVRLHELCGAEGYRMEGNVCVAVRFDEAGSEVVLDRFQLTQVNG